MFEFNGHKYLDEADVRAAGFGKIAGIDEAGRGSGSGPVVVACVMLPVNHGIPGLRDSKKLSSKAREFLYQSILQKALSVSIAQATSSEIDKINIYQATKKCIYSVVKNSMVPEFLFIDGKFDELDSIYVPFICVPGADGAQIYTGKHPRTKKQIGHHYENVAAASIIAKVYRDNIMVLADLEYPEYGFKKNKGYLTKEHRKALKKYGPSPIHRRSFRGCS